MCKLQDFFRYLINLEDSREDAECVEYVKVVCINREKYSSLVVANKEGITLIKSKLKKLRLSCNIVQITSYDCNARCSTGTFNILDIGI